MESHKGWGSGRWYLLGTLVVAVLVLGTWGWLVAKPDIGLEEAFYRAIQLFVLEMPEEAYSIPLDFARWIAVGVAFIAVLQVLLRNDKNSSTPKGAGTTSSWSVTVRRRRRWPATTPTARQG